MQNEHSIYFNQRTHEKQQTVESCSKFFRQTPFPPFLLFVHICKNLNREFWLKSAGKIHTCPESGTTIRCLFNQRCVIEGYETRTKPLEISLDVLLFVLKMFISIDFYSNLTIMSSNLSNETKGFVFLKF